MIERRQFGRRKVCKQAKILSQDQTWLRCIVVDISEGGARIQLLEGAPTQLHTLVIPEDDAAFACEIANSTPNQIGVKFIALPQRIANFTRTWVRSAHCLAKNATGEVTARTGPWAPNRIGVADGGTDQHASAARDYGGGSGTLPIGQPGGEGGDPRRAVQGYWLASQACDPEVG